MAGKSFRRSAQVEEIWFEVPGPDGEDVRFQCVPDLPGGILLDFGSLMGGNNEETGGNVTTALAGFFEAVIVKDQYQLWVEMTHDPRCGITLSMIGDVAAYLGQQYSGDRPTGASSAPTSPSLESGNGSKDGALHEMSTYSRSGGAGLTR